MHKANKGIRLQPNNFLFFRCYFSLTAILFLLLAFQNSCTNKNPDTETQNQTQLPTGATSVSEAEDGQWLMPAKNYASTRFSGLDQINTQNVGNLKVAWTFSTGVNRGQEAAPLVVGDTMYVVSPYPNILYALDLKNNGAAKWKYEPKPEAAAMTPLS